MLMYFISNVCIRMVYLLVISIISNLILYHDMTCFLVNVHLLMQLLGKMLSQENLKDHYT